MKHYIIILLLLAISHGTFAQEKWSQEAEQVISRVIPAKRNYEQYRLYAENLPQRYAAKRDSTYAAYVSYIKKIKQKPDVYLDHLNYVIHKPKGPEDFNLHYSYTSERSIGLPYDRNKYTISKIDLYRVIKYYLFDQDADVLPELLDDVAIPIKRDHYPPFKLQTIEDIRRDDTVSKQ